MVYIPLRIHLNLVSYQPHYSRLINFFCLGTHEFQNISVNSTAPGEIVVSGDFTTSSEAIGVLIITYSLNNDSDIHYTFVPRPINGQKSVIGLSSDQYNVSVFVIEGNGLPFNRSASRPRIVYVVGESGETIINKLNSKFFMLLHS